MSCVMWDLPRPGVEPVSPALAGAFFTTEETGKPIFYGFKYGKDDGICLAVQHIHFLSRDLKGCPQEKPCDMITRASDQPSGS